MAVIGWLLWLTARVVHGPARWLSRRFTTAGAMVAGGLLVTLGIANPQMTLGLPAGLLLGLLLLTAMAAAPFFRPRISLVRQAPRLATCGEPITCSITLMNHGAGPQDGLWYGEDLHAPAPSRAEVRGWLRRGRSPGPLCPPVRVPRLPPGGSATVAITITPRRRGVLALPGGLLSRADALGLFNAFQALPVPGSLLVLPRRHPLPPLALPGLARLQPGGVALASGIGEAEEFAALRDYRRGDPLKHIHWRTTARTGELVVKEYHDEQIVRHALILDTDLEDAERFEDAVAVAASFACTVPDQDSLLDLLFIGDRAVHLTSGRGTGQVQPMLEALAVAQPRRGGFTALAELVRGHARACSGCLLVLASLDAPRRALVGDLRQRGIPVVVLLLVGHGERTPPVIEAPAERPDRLVVLEAGRIGEDLQQVGVLA